MSATKTVCPMSRDEFRAHAKPIGLDELAKQLPGALPKEFSTGSFGWYAGGKVQLQVNGQIVTVQVGLNMTVIGSKPNGDGK